jgi:DNA-binding MarR family transcriptional regulator
VLENSSKETPLTSLEISDKLGVAPPRVNHHLRNLINAGILVRRRNRIYLRRKPLHSLINELRKDIDRVLTDVEDVAKSIDRELGLDRKGW